MSDLRNFRSNYLEKVGIKGVEEKKSIEILLREQDLGKLIQYCLRFDVHAIYRPMIWKIILGVLPTIEDFHECVMVNRREQYEDLHEALKCLGAASDSTGESLFNMYLLQIGKLPFNYYQTNPLRSPFVHICDLMTDLTDDPVDAYWLTTKFLHHCNKPEEYYKLLSCKALSYTFREDSDHKLEQHFSLLSLTADNLPLTRWFQHCFAGTLPVSALGRVLDKVIAGSSAVLACVAASILLTFKRPIQVMMSSEQVLKYLDKIPSDSGDIVVNRALDIWHRNGSLLSPVFSKTESPPISST